MSEAMIEDHLVELVVANWMARDRGNMGAISDILEEIGLPRVVGDSFEEWGDVVKAMPSGLSERCRLAILAEYERNRIDWERRP